MVSKHIQFNKNIIIAFVVALLVSAAAAELLADLPDYLNSTYVTIIDYSVYFLMFGGLFYLDNRKRYRLESGDMDSARLKSDLKKLITSLGISEVVYGVSRWLVQYYLLNIALDPYLASIIAQSVAFVIFLGVINLSIRFTRMYRD